MPKLPGRVRSNTFAEANFKPYVSAIGRLVLGWNALHEELASIFCRLMGTADEDTRSLAVWHAVQFDRPKRTMLRGALKVEQSHAANKEAFDDVIWLLNETDELEKLRNDAVHSPLLLLGYTPLANYAGLAGWVIPDAFNKNPRALRLLQNDVLEDFRWGVKAIAVLRKFAEAIVSSLEGSKPWPDKPSLPARSAKKRSPLARYQVPRQ